MLFKCSTNPATDPATTTNRSTITNQSTDQSTNPATITNQSTDRCNRELLRTEWTYLF